MGVGKGNKQTHCAPHFPLPRPVASVKFSANKRRGGRQDREERCKKDKRGTRATAAGRSVQQMVMESDHAICPSWLEKI